MNELDLVVLRRMMDNVIRTVTNGRPMLYDPHFAPRPWGWELHDDVHVMVDADGLAFAMFRGFDWVLADDLVKIGEQFPARSSLTEIADAMNTALAAAKQRRDA